MKQINGGTLKERLARLEVLMCNHLEHHNRFANWLLGITATSVGGLIIATLPRFVSWLRGGS